MREPRRDNADRISRYKHQLIASDILARIQSGEWRKGAKLPSIDELEKTYEYSRMTIFKAIQELARQGHLRAERGVGTFVARDRQAGRIGLLVDDDVFRPQNTPWAAMFAKALQTFVERIDYSFKLYIEPCPDRPGRPLLMEDLAKDLRDQRLTGLVTANCDAPLYLPESREWADAGIPVVDVSTHETMPHRVVFDTCSVIDIWLRLCQGHGRDRLATLGVPNIAYFHEQAKRLHLLTRDKWSTPKSVTGEPERDGYEAMLALWEHADKPDALLVGDDIVAKGVVQAVAELGIKVPDELLVVTTANRDSGVFYPISLPQIEFDTGECARLAAEMLLDLIHRPDLPPRAVSLKPGLRMADGLRIV